MPWLSHKATAAEMAWVAAMVPAMAAQGVGDLGVVYQEDPEVD